MTVAIGLVCKDGVLVASDSMGSNQLIAQRVVKVRKFENNPVIWTGSGSVYVMEEVEAALKQGLDAKDQNVFTEPKLLLLRGKLKDAVVPAMRKCYTSALSTAPFAPGSTSQNFVADFLLLGYSNGSPWFLEIAGDGQLNWHTDNRFYATGSGGPFATVCHGLLRHYLEDDLTLDQATLVAYRAIATTCDVSSGFVGLPVQMAVVDQYGARVLTEAEVEEIGVGVERWKAVEAGTLRMTPETAKESALSDLPPPASND